MKVKQRKKLQLFVTGMFGSAFELFFSDEQPETEENMSVNLAVMFLDKEIYAVITTNRETKFNIMNIDNKSYEKLKEILWKVVEIDYHIEKYRVSYVTADSDGNKITKTRTKKKLIINVECLSLDKMMDLYKMNKSERKQVEEMMNGQFDEMWEEILQ